MVGFWCDPDFLREIDGARGHVQRSQFVRDAIVEKLQSMGRTVPVEWTVAPDRTGKGGRPTHKSRTTVRYPARTESVILNDRVNTKPTIEGVDPMIAKDAIALATVAQRKARELGERDRAREKARAERQGSKLSRKAASTSGSTSGPTGGTGQRNK